MIVPLELTTKVPVLCVPGEDFSARVSPALALGLGLAEMVARDHGDFLELVVAAASRPRKLASIATRLRKMR